MACITVGLDTSRVYKKKQPPGGACADLFGGEQQSSGETKKLNRLPSTTSVPEPVRTSRKSLPSVCPVTGETIGHNLPPPEAVPNAETAITGHEHAKPIAEDKHEKHAIKKVGEKQVNVEVKGDVPDMENAAPVSTIPETLSMPSSPASTPAQPAVETISTPAVISSEPAPVKTTSRRVPPGGHTSSLW